ncbi:hypothetical protein [Roseinatronobacter sp. NSM]|uniref:hypothetical protein n=1 Tax=Roseinatronobacter sp. NSM TaxID=3457785 RepID=UPI004035CA97
MSFFAGFVQGVFQGKDWREARDDRKRRREFEDEDREWTGEARGRQRDVWGQQDEDRERRNRQSDEDRRVTQSERERREALERQERELLGGLFDGNRDQGLSASEALPDGRDTRQDTRPPQRRSLTLEGLGQVGASAQGQMSNDLLADRVARQEPVRTSPQPRVAGQPTDPRTPDATTSAADGRMDPRAGQPVQPLQAAQQMPQQPQAPRQWIDSTPPIVVQTPSGPIRQDVLPPAPRPANPTRQIAPDTDMYDRQAWRGLSLNNLIASPAAASTVQDSVTTGTPYTAAELPPRAQQNLPVSDDHPFRGAIERDRARGGLSSAADTQNPQIGRRIALGVSDIADRLQNPQIDTSSPEFQEFQRMNPEAATQAIEQSQAAQQRQAQRQAEREAIAGSRRNQGTQQPPAPAPAPQGSQPQGADAQPRAARRDVDLRISGRQADLGGVADAVTSTDSGTPILSVRRGENEIAQSAGMSAARALRPGSQQAPNRTQVRESARRVVKRFEDHDIERIESFYVQQGDFAKAKAFRDWAGAANTRRGMEKWAEAMTYWGMNDDENFLDAITQVYNSQGYYDDGLTAVREGTSFEFDQQGQIIGATVTFRDESTGQTFRQQINGPRDLIGSAIIGALAPESVFDIMEQAIGGFGPQQQQGQITPAQRVSIRQQAMKEAEAAAGLGGQVTPEMIDQAEERILSRMMGGVGAGVGGDVPLLTE